MKHSDSAVNILYCDNHLVAAHKPAGTLTQPDGSSTPHLEGLLKEWIKERFHKPGNVFLHAVHRLDKPVSGIVLFARTSKALSRLNEQVRSQEIRRRYQAEVEGRWPDALSLLEHWMEHDDHCALISSSSSPLAKLARLHVQVEEHKADRTRLGIELETGRYHQIRAQLSHMGHPIIGDVRYGAKSRGSPLIHLHCAELSFIHPITKEALHFKSPLLY